jgi:hypothetical protein
MHLRRADFRKTTNVFSTAAIILYIYASLKHTDADAAAAVHDVLLLIIIFYYLRKFYIMYLITGDRHRTAPGPSVHRHIHSDWHLVDVHIFP